MSFKKSSMAHPLGLAAGAARRSEPTAVREGSLRSPTRRLIGDNRPDRVVFGLASVSLAPSEPEPGPTSLPMTLFPLRQPGKQKSKLMRFLARVTGD
jgi:hypothetical protein